MKKIFLTLIFALSLFAQSEVTNTTTGNVNESKLALIYNNPSVEKQGCCSWHGGVQGCSGGRLVCNDGTLSPSCTCLGGEPISDVKTN